MRKIALLALLALPALAGCNPFGAGGTANQAAAANSSDGAKVAVTGANGGDASDAGITDRRALSFGGLGGGNQVQTASASDVPPDGGGKPIAPADTPEATQPFNAAMLIGRWGDNGDCSQPIDIESDGTFATANGGSGNWAVNGDMLTMNGPGGSFRGQVRVVDGSHILLVNQDGSIGRSQRC